VVVALVVPGIPARGKSGGIARIEAERLVAVGEGRIGLAPAVPGGAAAAIDDGERATLFLAGSQDGAASIDGVIAGSTGADGTVVRRDGDVQSDHTEKGCERQKGSHAGSGCLILSYPLTAVWKIALPVRTTCRRWLTNV